MLAATSELVRFLAPPRIAKLIGQAETVLTSGLWAEPLELLNQWKHRRQFMRLQKALLYHRWTTALLLGHEVGVYRILSKSPRNLTSLARACHIHPRAADQLLRILGAQGIVHRDGEVYQLTPFAQAYLSEGSRLNVTPILSLMAAQASAFHELPASMADGGVPSALDIFDEDGRYEAFLDAVNAYLYWAGRDLLARIKLPVVKNFIVGSMGVSFSSVVLEQHPDSTVTYGCLEHLVREIPRLRKQYGVDAKRVEGMHSHGGDPKQDTWGDEEYDLVFLTKKMILAPEERMGEKFAAKALDVLRPGGVAIFWETIHPDSATTPLPVAMEAVMDLGASPTGLVNTRDGIRTMLRDLGYAKVEIVPCLGGQTTFVVGRKGH